MSPLVYIGIGVALGLAFKVLGIHPFIGVPAAMALGWWIGVWDRGA